jgi:hypothetical protein
MAQANMYMESLKGYGMALRRLSRRLTDCKGADFAPGVGLNCAGSAASFFEKIRAVRLSACSRD